MRLAVLAERRAKDNKNVSTGQTKMLIVSDSIVPSTPGKTPYRDGNIYASENQYEEAVHKHMVCAQVKTHGNAYLRHTILRGTFF